MSRNQVYISQGQFDFFCQTKRPYEGFVEGVGYAFVQSGFVNPYSDSPTNPFLKSYGHVLPIQQQLIESSPDLIAQSLKCNKTTDMPEEDPDRDSRYLGERFYTEDGRYVYIGNTSGGWSCYDRSGNKVLEQMPEVIVYGQKKSSKSVIEVGKDVSNVGLGAASTYMVYKGGYYKWNEAWHLTKTRGIRYCFQRQWKNPGAAYWRKAQTGSVRSARNTAGKLTKVGGVLLVTDIALSGELKPSHAINAVMLGVSSTGVGSIVAGAWFLLDFGTMGVNYLINGEAKGLSDMIDESIGTFEMYDGLY